MLNVTRSLYKWLFKHFKIIKLRTLVTQSLTSHHPNRSGNTLKLSYIMVKPDRFWFAHTEFICLFAQTLTGLSISTFLSYSCSTCWLYPWLDVFWQDISDIRPSNYCRYYCFVNNWYKLQIYWTVDVCETHNFL